MALRVNEELVCFEGSPVEASSTSMAARGLPERGSGLESQPLDSVPGIQPHSPNMVYVHLTSSDRAFPTSCSGL